MPKDFYLELVSARVSPAGRPYEAGLALREGFTVPFVVERSWAGPAGNYTEQWSIRRHDGEVLFHGDSKWIRVRGMQSVTEWKDVVDDPLRLDPGTYLLVFVVEGHFMGSVEIAAAPDRVTAG